MSTAGSGPSEPAGGAAPERPQASPPSGAPPPSARRKVRILRWQGIIPICLLIVLLVFVWAIFGDRIIEETTEEASTELLGTQVDIAALRLAETEPAADIRGIAVADPFNPMRNLVEVGHVEFDLEPVPLLEQKLVIRQLAIRDVRFGTARETPAQPASENSFAAQTLSGVKRWAEQFDVPLLKLTPIDTIRSIVLNPAQLTTVREAMALRARTDSVRTALQGGFQGLKLEETLDSARTLAERLQDANPAKLGIEGTKRAVEDVRRTIALIDAARKRVEALEQNAKTSVAALGAGVRQLDQARRKDYAFARGLLKLPTFEGPEIGRALFGEVSIDRFQQAVYWAELAQKYIPPGLLPRSSPGPNRLRRSGQTVHFPKEEEYPTFLLRQGELSFAVGGGSLAAGDYSARIANLTTAPELVSEPTRFTARRAAKRPGAVALQAGGVLDHRNRPVRDSVAAAVSNFELPDFALPGLPLRLDPKVGSMGFSFARVGERIAGRWSVNSEQVTWLTDSARVAGRNPIEEIVYRVVTGLKELNLTANLSGTLSSPRLSVSSNLDEQISKRLRAVAGEEIAKAEKKVRAEVNRLVDERTKPVIAQVATVRAESEQRVADAKARLEEEKKRLEAQLQSLTKGVIELPKLPGLPKVPGG